MLNEDEEGRLSTILALFEQVSYAGPVKLDDKYSKWLAEKLKEVNEELKVAQKCSSDLMRAAQEQYEKHAHCRHN